MKNSINNVFVATATAAALSLSMASAAFAETPTLQSTVLAANTTMDKAEEAVSDTWITGKVKSTFLAEDSLSGMDIKVETNKGVVALSGVVASDAERDLAIAKAKEIKGVTAVSADGLKSAD
ncbi:hyperosmotically inducible protein [Pseudomonas cuatrocienegasensis]|jgi:hyperosmotically inducible protein|uniref:Hyperosmotically inducible protein n=1 Tax=Pseudomonas cuatrocienegasensis TaxID=543360 RepID=A0ABY1BLE6_9PSED|nr:MULTISPECIES: BON domain-containing protein [Pseudomonas]OEC34343.1 phospholipid-binding protein [Pseudomonas sp. 21C1]SER10797.1 hyperosmotically inducible protein [Pseudomonas cuatrocienegasensis]